MEDLGNYKIFVYLILALLYFLFSGNKKKPVVKNTPPQPQESSYPKTEVQKSKKPLLKEVKTISGKSKNVPQTPSTALESISLEDIVKEFTGKAEVSKPKREIYIEDLEDVKPKVIDYEADYQEEISTKHSVFGKDERAESFEPYSTDRSRVNKYAAILKDKESLKTVFVAQEIFNRKHF